MKNVLITGASGAFGRAVIAELEQNYKYPVFTTGRRSSPVSNAHFVCDIRDKSQIEEVIKHSNPDVILHLAASISSDFEESYAINVQSTKNILDFVQLKSLKTRVILIGSAAEYGIIHPHENPIREDHVLAPVSVYGISKAWQTQLMGLYTSQGVDALCARVFNLYGPGISNQLFAGCFANQIADVLSGAKNTIEVGSLSAVRDYISTTDAAKQLLAIMSYGKSGATYHVASGVPCVMRDFANTQLEKNGLSSDILKESPIFFNRKGYDVPVIFADIASTSGLQL